MVMLENFPQNAHITNRPVLKQLPMLEAVQGDKICPGLWKEGLREARLMRKLLSMWGQVLV